VTLLDEIHETPMKEARRMNDTSNKARRELVQTARSIVAGDLDLVSGCRKLSKLSRRFDPSDRIFDPIVGFDSETDDYPLDEVRETYQKAYLEKLDKEILEYAGRARLSILNSLKLIIAKYGV
jgi:hypothetical protein